jgi:RNA polymerase sigma factor (sigma-70 family)
MGASAIEEKPTVVIVDDDLDVREGVKALVESVGLQCQVYSSPKDFLKRSPADDPSCIILDVRLPEMNGLDLQAELARDCQGPPIIIISGYGDIPMTVRAMKAGAVAFLTKPMREQDVLDAVLAALKQHQARLEQERSFDQLRSRFQRLTDREREVLPLVTAGLLNKQIAAEMGLSEVTVKVHRHKLMVKLQAKTLPELVRMADALGIWRTSRHR